MTIFRQGQLGLGGTSQAFGANGQGPFPALVASGSSGGGATQVISSNGATLIVGDNVILSSAGAFSGNLPPLSSVSAGESVYVSDGNYDLSANNYTVSVDATDDASGIILFGAAGVDSIALSNSDQIAKFISLGVGNGWRLVYYGV